MVRATMLMLLLAACGEGTSATAADAAAPADGAADAAPRTDGSTLNDVCMGSGAPTGAHRLYLSFDGESITKGQMDDATQNISTIAKGAIVVPPYRGAAGNRALLIADTVAAVAD